MPETGAKWLQTANDLWLVRQTEEGLGIAQWGEGKLHTPVVVGHAPGGWDATVDADGIPWVVWSDGHIIRARRAPGGTWGPSLQVSTVGDDSAPLVAPDTFGNVWIFWWRAQAREVRMCRMGPRSGQETLVAAGQDAPPAAACTTEGTFYVALANGDIAQGTEHGGFGPPIRTER